MSHPHHEHKDHKDHHHKEHKHKEHHRKKSHKKHHESESSSSSDSESECHKMRPRKHHNHCKIELLCRDVESKNVFSIFAGGDFYNVNSENSIIPSNSDLLFPNDSTVFGYDVTRLSSSSFKLGALGTYQVSFNVPTNEPAQLALTLNGSNLLNTLSGNANTVLVKTPLVNSVITLRNMGSQLTYVPNLTSHLVITKLN
jgi:hypothetical protein